MLLNYVKDLILLLPLYRLFEFNVKYLYVDRKEIRISGHGITIIIGKHKI